MKCIECGEDCESGLCESCSNAFKREEYEAEAREDRREREDEGKRRCEFCKERFDDEDLDLIKMDRGESVWICGSCESEMREINDKEEQNERDKDL